MPTLKITRLDCVKTRDGIGKDEIDIYVSPDGGNEVFLSGPHLLDKSKNDDRVDLAATKAFDSSIQIRLKERNGPRGGNNDLDLGAKTVYADETRPHTHPFKGNNGRVAYDLTYTVTS